MANIDLAVGQINITNNLIARARKVATPLVEETREVYPAPLPASFNVILPSSGSIDPTVYYVDFYESSDGTTLDLLLAQFVVNAKNDLVTEETRFYLVDGLSPTDPPANQDTLTDPYLDGKTISRVFKDGVGRPLVDENYTYNEWELVSGGGIKLIGGQLFTSGEIIAIVISYLSEQQAVSGSNMYNSVVTITADTTLDSTYRNKRIRCVGASSRLVVTLEDVSTVPEGTFYHFTHNDGSQLQTRILPNTGDSITYGTSIYTELSIGPGEYLRIEKIGSIWEAVLVHQGVLQVGERFAAGWESHPNTKPENGVLYDGDDWPRPWYWLNNFLPATHKISDAAVTGGGYVHPAGKEGLFVVHPTLKKFRLPNTQGWFERGLNSFSSFNADAERTYDYPGGTQPESVGDIPGITISGTAVALAGGNGGVPNVKVLSSTIVPPFHGGDTTVSGLDIDSSKTNVTKNIGVIYLRRF
jgi:hypothetical protein